MKRLFKYAPRPLLCGLRTAWILVAKRGQTKRDKDGNCIDAEGNPIPWMTYSAIDFLSNLDLSQATVFEYGSGASTLFWAKRCKSVCAVEHFVPWFERMKKYIDGRINIISQPDLTAYPKEIEPLGLFDLIYIDGAERMPCAKAACNHLNEGGIIILDNSEWYPQSATFLREQGFMQIDFCGFEPLNSFTSMTSIFLKEHIKFPYIAKPHGWTPIGGKALDHIPPDDQP